VIEVFCDYFCVLFVVVDVENCFFEWLWGLSDLEVKCKVIGVEFICVFEEEV